MATALKVSRHGAWLALLVVSLLVTASLISRHRFSMSIPLPPSPVPAIAPSPTPALPPASDDDEAMTAALFHYLENPEQCCRKLTMFGGMTVENRPVDGDKFVCLDAKHAPPPGNCLVYSVGIANEWSFDRAMVQYGCEVHCFDPSMTSYTRDVTEFGAHFYRIGLGGQSWVRKNGWQMMTLTDIRRSLGHTDHDIHYLKVDIEASEWAWLENDPQSLRGVHQLGMEVHMTLKPASLRKHYAVFRTIQEAGFALVHVNANRVFGRTFKVKGVQKKVSNLYELVWVKS